MHTQPVKTFSAQHVSVVSVFQIYPLQVTSWMPVIHVVYYIPTNHIGMYVAVYQIPMYRILY